MQEDPEEPDPHPKIQLPLLAPTADPIPPAPKAAANHEVDPSYTPPVISSVPAPDPHPKTQLPLLAPTADPIPQQPAPKVDSVTPSLSWQHRATQLTHITLGMVIAAVIMLPFGRSAAVTNQDAPQQFRVQAYDCSSPRNLKPFLPRVNCTQRGQQPWSDPQDYHIVQSTPTQRMPGHSCQLRRHVTLSYCGIWSYSKVVSSRTEPVMLSVAQCRQIIEDKTYRAPDGSEHRVQIPGVTVITLQEKGEHHVDNNGVPVCEGVDIKHEGKILHQALQDAQYTVTVREEKFEWRRQADAVDVLTARESLRCTRNERGCAGLLSTYYWGRVAEECEWSWVREFQGVRMNQILAGLDDRVLFNVSGGSIQAPSRCPEMMMMPTQLPDIRIAGTAARELYPIAPWQTNIVDEIELSAEHLQFHLDELQSPFHAAGLGCPDVTTTEDDHIVPVQPPCLE